MRELLAAGSLLALVALPLPAAPSDYYGAITTAGRPADMVAFDATWKPAEVLDFFQLKPGMTALDIIADGGYYSEIMARVVGPQGRVIALVYDENAVKETFAGLRERNANIEFKPMPMHTLRAQSLEPDRYDFVLLNMMYHDVYWTDEQAGVPRIEPENVLAALFPPAP